ncbi:uncharacterized protein LOC122282354 [Carya illinoinensis]|uniref:uncharacterized protein LOC122282354 n=1 Tax=Carya illinoinensis TaxID=32201 RepID=UPI001C725559|nr:uncharacterized protein LOC122282354 [Carya illinoinensis]
MERRNLWEELHLSSTGAEPCLFAGDFNIIRSELEQKGGRPRPRLAMDEFNSWIHLGGLIDVKSQGCKFSWCNGQRGFSRSWAKLDRVLIDPNLLTKCPNVTCSYLPRTTSDHCPMYTEFRKDPFSYGPSPFRFQQMWVEHPDFMDFVQNVWAAVVVGTGLLKLANKLKKLKVAFWEWNKTFFGRTNVQIDVLEKKVEELEGSLQRDWNEDVERELVSSTVDLSSWRRREDTRLAQMAKLKWKMEGDRNTKFFHVCLASKRNKRIQEMRPLNGVEYSSLEDIHQGAINYFSGFLQNTNQSRELPDLSYLISPVIDEADSTRICCIPTLDEVHEALSSIPINSSPAPDRFGAGFFNCCWEVVKMDVLYAISEFFISKSLPRFYTASFIMLIPKMDAPSGFDKFRPISLCSVFYKICSKILLAFFPR